MLGYLRDLGYTPPNDERRRWPTYNVTPDGTVDKARRQQYFLGKMYLIRKSNQTP